MNKQSHQHKFGLKTVVAQLLWSVVLQQRICKLLIVFRWSCVNCIRDHRLWQGGDDGWRVTWFSNLGFWGQRKLYINWLMFEVIRMTLDDVHLKDLVNQFCNSLYTESRAASFIDDSLKPVPRLNLTESITSTSLLFDDKLRILAYPEVDRILDTEINTQDID